VEMAGAGRLAGNHTFRVGFSWLNFPSSAEEGLLAPRKQTDSPRRYSF
jgi:hypothetical protein